MTSTGAILRSPRPVCQNGQPGFSNSGSSRLQPQGRTAFSDGFCVLFPGAVLLAGAIPQATRSGCGHLPGAGEDDKAGRSAARVCGASLGNVRPRSLPRSTIIAASPPGNVTTTLPPTVSSQGGLLLRADGELLVRVQRPAATAERRRRRATRRAGKSGQTAWPVSQPSHGEVVGVSTRSPMQKCAMCATASALW